MPLEIAALAASVVGSFLMPLVKKGAQKITETVSEKFSEAAGEHLSKVAGKVWDRVKAAFSSDEDRATLAQFEKRPDASQSLVKEVLEEKLTQDSKLAEELNTLIQSPSPDGSGTAVNISAATVGYVDARGAHISGGIVAGVIMHPPPPPSPSIKPSPSDG